MWFIITLLVSLIIASALILLLIEIKRIRNRRRSIKRFNSYITGTNKTMLLFGDNDSFSHPSQRAAFEAQAAELRAQHPDL